MTQESIDLTKQRGFPNKPITRQMIIAAIEALGIDPTCVSQVSLDHDEVTVTMFVHTVDGHKVLGAPGDTFGVDDCGGFLKHTYTARINDENGDSK